MSKSEASGFIYDFMTKINLEDGPFMNALNGEIEESFYKEAEKNPEKLFKSIEENIDNFMGSPIQQAELMDYLTKINGMEEKAKEVILNNLNKKIPEKEMKLTDIKTLEDENKFFSADPKEIAYKMKFASLISVAENQEEEKKLTMDVFNSDSSEVFNIGSEEQVSINQMIKMIEEIAEQLHKSRQFTQYAVGSLCIALLAAVFFYVLMAAQLSSKIKEIDGMLGAMAKRTLQMTLCLVTIIMRSSTTKKNPLSVRRWPVVIAKLLRLTEHGQPRHQRLDKVTTNFLCGDHL